MPKRRKKNDGIKADVVGNDLSQGRDDATGLGGHSSLFRRQAHAKVARRTVAVAIAFRTGRRSRLKGHGDRLPRTSQAVLCQRNQVGLSQNMVPQYFMFHSIGIMFSSQFPFWQYTPFSDMCCHGKQVSWIIWRTCALPLAQFQCSRTSARDRTARTAGYQWEPWWFQACCQFPSLSV